MPSENLSPQQKRVRKLIVKKRDTPIVTLYAAARSEAIKVRDKTVNVIRLPNARRQQQDVGAIITRINKTLAADKLIIRPGKVRGTYRLYDLTT